MALDHFGARALCLLFDNLVVTSEIFLPAQDCALADGQVLFTRSPAGWQANLEVSDG